MLRGVLLVTTVCAVAVFAGGASAQQVPAALAAPGEVTLANFHAEGAQVYECKADADGKLAWTFREPIATLLLTGKTVGRHYAGPTWELSDGSAITGESVANSPGETSGDIPWLKLEVTSHRGNGLLSNVNTIQRLDTHGGTLQGACDQAGSFRSISYSADYSFLGKANDLTASVPKHGQSR
jgi:hypothetical protein